MARHIRPHLEAGLCICDCRRCTVEAPSGHQICVCHNCDARRCGMHDGTVPSHPDLPE